MTEAEKEAEEWEKEVRKIITVLIDPGKPHGKKEKKGNKD